MLVGGNLGMSKFGFSDGTPMREPVKDGGR